MRQRLALLAIALCVVVLTLAAGGNRSACAQASARDLEALKHATYIYIGTVRKDGNQSTNTPVWFTVAPNHQVLIETGPNSWKAKRIRRGSPALIWIGAADGPAFIGKAEITSDPAVESRIIEDYPQRYTLARIGYAKPTREKFDSGKIVAIRITPLRDLPDGFRNDPGKPAPKLDAPGAVPSTGAPRR